MSEPRAEPLPPGLRTEAAASTRLDHGDVRTIAAPDQGPWADVAGAKWDVGVLEWLDQHADAEARHGSCHPRPGVTRHAAALVRHLQAELTEREAELAAMKAEHGKNKCLQYPSREG